MSTQTHHVYITGKHDDRYVIVTVELLKETNVNDLLQKPERMHNAFYHGGLIDCGKVKAIETLDEGRGVQFADVNVTTGTALPVTTVRLHLNKFFLNNIEDKTGLRVFRHKAGALNYVEHVPNLFTGVRYYYHFNGLLRKKVLFERGDTVREVIHRNDTFNTIEAVKQYESNILNAIFYYTEDEVLRRKVLYNADGEEKS